MNDQTRKSLDNFSDESERFEERFESLLAGPHDEAESDALIAEITQWMKACARQGLYIPPASAERRAFRSLLERWSSRLRDQGHYVEEVDTLLDFDPKAGFVLTGECPYPGLEPYDEDRRARFFGRESLIESSVRHIELQGHRILLIIGASGSGKSSLAMAGILPQLLERHGDDWLFGPRMTPGAQPLSELAVVVANAIGEPDHAQEIERELAADPNGASDQLAALCRDKPLMLFVDQFEELLTMCRDVGEQSTFAQVLCALSKPGVSSDGFSCRILLTLRTDHLARFESNSALQPLHMRLVGEDNQHYLSAIGFEDIKRAIKGPADEVGLRFLPATLIDELASQTAGLSNGLPLLQFALRQLWQTRPTNDAGEPLDIVNEEMVKRLPDVERALGTVADNLFRTFSMPQQRICERLFLELLVLDESFEEPLRRRRNEAEIVQVLEAHFPYPGEAANVIDRFVAAGLLRRFGEEPTGQLEVAHEALLRHWDHIYRILTGAEVKERLHLVKQIGREAGDWATHNRSHDYLSLRGERLVQATRFAADGWLAEADAAAYVEACRFREEEEKQHERIAQEEKERADLAQKAREAAELRALRARRDLWRLAVLAVLVITALLGWAWYQVDKETFAQELAVTAQLELDRNSQGSLLLTLEAARTLNGDLTPPVESALRGAIRNSRVAGLFKGLPKTSFNSIAYSPDGTILALGDSLGGITLWDTATGLQRKVLISHVDDVYAIAFSPDGRKIASGGADGKVVIWDVASGVPLHIMQGHVGEVKGLAFSRGEGRLLATVSDDASLRIWDVASGKPRGAPLYGHIGGVKAVAFGRDDRQLATAGEDNSVKMWDIHERRVLYSLPVKGLFDIDLSGDGSLLAIATNTNVEIWDTGSRDRRWILTGHTNSVFVTRFSPDQKLVATGGWDSTARIWRLPNSDGKVEQQVEEIARIQLEPSKDLRKTYMRTLAFGPKGDSIAVPFFDGTAVIWNIAAGGELLTLTGNESSVRAVAFSADGNTIAAAGSSSGRVLAWDLSGKQKDTPFTDSQSTTKAVAFSKTGALAIGSGRDVLVTLPGISDPIRLKGHKRIVNDVAFSPDGSNLVSVSHDKTAMVWELPAGKLRKPLEGHDDDVLAVAYSPDGKLIATGSRDSTIILWHADSLKQKMRIKGHLIGILDLAFTPDGKHLVSGSKDKTVRIWDVATGEPQSVLGVHRDSVYAVAIHGKYLATGGDDEIRLWDLETLTPLPVFPARGHGAHSLAFSADGRYLAAGAADGVVRVYAMQYKELVELASKHVHRGWSAEECRNWLEPNWLRRFLLGREWCPRTSFNILDEAYESFEKLRFKEGERLLREARGSTRADAKAIEAEVNSRLGGVFLWAATDAVMRPEFWKEVVEGQKMKAEELPAYFLVGAKEKLGDQAFDSLSRLRDLLAYQHVRQARRLAQKGKLDESAAAFAKARDAGWEMSNEPDEAATELYLANKAQRMKTDDVELLARFPAYGPGHHAIAWAYERQGQYGEAKKHYELAATKESCADPLNSLAYMATKQYDQKRDARYAREAAANARRALKYDPASDMAWFLLGYAEHRLQNEEEAVKAFDRVSPFASFSADALNVAASIYFEHLNNDHAAYQRLARAMQMAPNDFSILANFAEFLLASGRDGQAKVIATRARSHIKAKPYSKAAMSFVIFTAHFVSGDYTEARAEIDKIEHQVKAAAQDAKAATAKGEQPERWLYAGTRRSLERRLRDYPPRQASAIRSVLAYVESNGQTGTLKDIRQILATDVAKH